MMQPAKPMPRYGVAHEDDAIIRVTKAEGTRGKKNNVPSELLKKRAEIMTKLSGENLHDARHPLWCGI